MRSIVLRGFAVVESKQEPTQAKIPLQVDAIRPEFNFACKYTWFPFVHSPADSEQRLKQM